MIPFFILIKFFYLVGVSISLIFLSKNFTITLLILCDILVSILIILLVVKSRALRKANKTIECEEKLYESLLTSYDSVRGFKHDFSNIMQSIGGYIFTNDINGLKKYYSSVFSECKILNKFSSLNKDVFNSPPVLSIVTDKFYKARELGIDFNIEVLTDLTSLNIDIYEFTRMLGIFLDNSIEAASKSSKKVINVIITKDIRNSCDLMIIENSFSDKSIDTNKIFDKNFSTKPKNSGIGLWKVKKILDKHDNLYLNTSVSDNLFRHQLRIYY